MVIDINRYLKFLLLFLTLLLGFTSAMAQDREVLAHIVTDIASQEGALVRLDKNTSTRYTQLMSLNGCVGVFCEDDYYVAFKSGNTDNTSLYTVANISSASATEYSTDYAHYMQPLSAIYHPTDSVIYVTYRDSDAGGYKWQSLRFNSESSTDVLTSSEQPGVELSKPYYAMCVTPEGVIYGFGADAALYIIDRTTGEGERLFSTGSVGMEQQSAWYDDENGVIYRAVPSSVGVTIYMYNLADKSERFVKIYTSVSAIVAMSPYVESDEVALPQPPRNLYVSIAEGANNGTLFFKAPQSDINDRPLEGTITHFITLDKVPFDTIRLTPDEQYSKEYIFRDGEHTISVVASNEVGKSTASEFGFFAGFDIPKPVSKVYVTCDFPYVDIAWEQPRGIHNKAVDVDKLRYRVVRYPDAVLVADTVATQVRDSLDMVAGVYYYGITAYLPDYETNQTYTDSFFYDCASQVPYIQNEWSEDMLYNFIVEDANQDGATWGYWETASGAKTMRYLYSSVNAADDYLYFPKLQLDGNCYYEATIYMHAGSEKYDEHFSIGITPADDTSQRRDILTDQTCRGKRSVPYKVGFTVAQDGAYRLYVHCTSPANRHMLHIDSIAIDVSGRSDVPAAVTNMMLTPDYNNPHIVTIDFVAPTHCANGSLLEDNIEEITIYRNDVPIYTYEQPAVGVALSYRDSVRDIATYNYKVVATNACGVGNESVQSIVRGVASYPYKHDFVDGIGYFTVNDNNADGVTWHYYDDRFMGCMRYMSSELNNADDWLISPPIYLSDSIRYQVEYSCCVGLSIYPESMRVMMGRVPRPNDMSVVIDELLDFTFINDTTIIAPFDVPLSGNYYIGFQASGRADSYSILLRNVAVNKYYQASAILNSNDEVRVWGATGCIMVQGCADTVIEVYNLSGLMVGTFTTTTMPYSYPISAGVYMVRCGKDVTKVVVR